MLEQWKFIPVLTIICLKVTVIYTLKSNKYINYYINQY